jgi:hypothetical protein
METDDQSYAVEHCPQHARSHWYELIELRVCFVSAHPFNQNHRRCRIRWQLAAVRPGQPDHHRPDRERRCVHCSSRHHTDYP